MQTLQSPLGDDNCRFLPRHCYAEKLKMKHVLGVAMNVQSAAACRFFRKDSVEELHLRKTSGGEVHSPKTKCAVPLTSDCASALPDPLRITALPCPNSEFDVNVQFALAQFRKLFDHYYSHQSIFIDGRAVSVRGEE